MKHYLTSSHMPAIARQLLTVLFLALVLSVFGLSLAGWRVSASGDPWALLARLRNWDNPLKPNTGVGAATRGKGAVSAQGPVQLVLPITAAYYRLGEDDAGAVSGATGNSTTSGRDAAGLNAGLNLTRSGSPTYTSSVAATAASAVGSNLGVTFNSAGTTLYSRGTPVTTATDNFGMEAWIKPATITGEQAYVANGNSGSSGYNIILWQGRYAAIYGGKGFIDTGGAAANATVGVWTHVAVVRNNGLTQLYINGVAVGGTASSTPNTPASGFAIAGNTQVGDRHHCDAAIDEVRVFTFTAGTFNPAFLLINLKPVQPAAAPEINLKGNNITIASGDTTPSAADHTDFGSTDISSGTVARTFTIENSGTAALTLSGSPKVALSGTNAADFSVTTQLTSPVAVTNGTTTFIITFDPSAVGIRTATVSIANNDSNENPYTFAIQGDGVITPPLKAVVGDPAVCLDPGGLVGNEATLTNPNNVALVSSLTATLPAGLTAIAGTCAVNVPGTCTIAANGGSVSWNGTLPANTTVTMIYRTRVAANTPNGTQFCIDNAGNVGGVLANLQFCFTLNCPVTTNTRVSDQKAGSVLVFPYYTSTIGGGSDTRMTISNISNAASVVANTAYVHLFFIDGTTCQQSDLYLCLTPNASFSFKASDYDPGNTGYLLAVVVNNQGVPIQNNILMGNAFVNTPDFADNYGAESFAANSFAVATVSGNTATLYFDHTGYDAVPKQFAVEIQSPIDAAGQQIVTAGLSGDLTTSQMSGAAQVGTGQAFNEKEVFSSFNAWLTGTCQARGTISTASPRVPNGLGNLIKTGQAGYLKFNVGGAVGLLLTPRTATWKGIRSLHKTQTTVTTLTIPLFVPVC